MPFAGRAHLVNVPQKIRFISSGTVATGIAGTVAHTENGGVAGRPRQGGHGVGEYAIRIGAARIHQCPIIQQVATVKGDRHVVPGVGDDGIRSRGRNRGHGHGGGPVDELNAARRRVSASGGEAHRVQAQLKDARAGAVGIAIHDLQWIGVTDGGIKLDLHHGFEGKRPTGTSIGEGNGCARIA